MTTISGVLDQLHITQPEGADLIFAQKVGRNWIHATFDSIADSDVEGSKEFYLATGAFLPDSLNHKGQGRIAENVASVLTAPFDADLTDYLGVSKEEVIGWDDDEIHSFIADLHKTLLQAFADLNIPLHRLDYTGHGLCAHVYLRDAKQDDTAPIMQAHKDLIAKINEHVGFRMIDPARSDAGPGIARVPGSLNTKNPSKPRTVTTLIPFSPIDFRLTPAQFIALAGTSQRTKPRTQPIVTPTEIPDDLSSDIVAAVAPVWTPGRRHMIALGLCGLLAKAGIPAQQTAEIIDAIATSAGDDEQWDRLTAVKTTYRRIADGQDVAGFSTLQREIGPQQLDYLTTRLDSLTRESHKPILLSGKTVNLHAWEDDLYVPVPEQSFYGWFGEYRDLMAPTTEASDTFHLAASLTLAGAMMGRAVYTGHVSKRLHANLFTMLVGKSGTSRKDTAMDRAIELPNHTSPTGTSIFTTPFVVKKHYGSGEKLVEDLQATPNILWKATEATVIFTTIRRQNTSTLRDRMIEAYDTPDFIENSVRVNASRAEHPYLSLLTAIQPVRLSDYISTEDIVSGLANRIMFFPGSPKRPMANPPSVDALAASRLYVRLHDAIKQYGPNPTNQINPRVMTTPEAEERMSVWYLSQSEDEDEDRQSMRSRNQTFVRKIALIYAVSDASPVIRLDHIEAAITLVEWQWQAVVRMLPMWGAQKESRIEQRIIETLRRHGPRLQRREVQQKCRNGSKWTTLDFNRVFEGMEKSGQIERETDDRTVVYFLSAV